MALIDCPECRTKISSLAVACPHCGLPLVCPECGHKHSPLAAPLVAPPKSHKQHLFNAILLASSLVAWSLVAWGIWKNLELRPEASPTMEEAIVSAPPAPVATPAPPPEAPPPEPTLSFAGSEVLGSMLVPSLAEAFLKMRERWKCGARPITCADSSRCKAYLAGRVR